MTKPVTTGDTSSDRFYNATWHIGEAISNMITKKGILSRDTGAPSAEEKARAARCSYSVWIGKDLDANVIGEARKRAIDQLEASVSFIIKSKPIGFYKSHEVLHIQEVKQTEGMVKFIVEMYPA